MDDLYIKKVLKGDTDAFKYFVVQYKDMAFTISMSVVKDEYFAADVVQESFVKAFQHLKHFKGKSKFSTWFYRIVINESIKVVRKNGEKYIDSEALSTFHPANEPVVLTQLKEDERQYFINETLIRLPANESLVLRLFYLNENHIDEICEMTGWTESKVKVLLHRARKNMEILLKKKLKSEAKTLI
ncbi:RNA polymerase sigma factor [Mariniphaga sediminis]|uniref:RNA polymerase sigma factor n=1 Tax=Mariniphaga sediminis TaxID=1628158 RepID=UPI003564048A